MIENFCAMHLGVNLRKVFLDDLEGSGITQLETFISRHMVVCCAAQEAGAPNP